MSYTTGTANDMAAVRAALISACTAEGWDWDASVEVLSKGTIFMRLQVTASGFLTLLGRTSKTAGDAPAVVQIGPFQSTSGYPLQKITYPATVHVFVFAHEVYLVVRHSGDYFLWAAFGRSSVAGLPGSGAWVAATGASSESATFGIYISASGGATGGSAGLCAAPFWADASNYRDCYVHSALDAAGWDLRVNGENGSAVNVSAMGTLIKLQPNTWNSESVLLPIRAYKKRPSSLISLVADLEHARYVNVANYELEQVITIGADRWMVFPFWRKNLAAGLSAHGENHSATFGWAIRYEGP